MALNKYLNRLDTLVAIYRDMNLEQFKNLEGEPASFNDLIWFYINPNSGRSTRILTGRHGTVGRGASGSRAKDALPSPYGDLIKVFVIETFNRPISQTEKVSQVAAARKLVSNISGDLYLENADSVMACFKGSRVERGMSFIKFCEHHGLMPKISERVRSYVRDTRDRSGNAEGDARRKKIADDRIIKAVGMIFSRVINENPSFSIDSRSRLRDAVPVFMSLLCLAAPNRAAAEIPLLTNQKLQFYVEDDRPKVYFLDWAGSKGFGNNRNHILLSLADKTELGLSFFERECEPGRILSRFYMNPKQTLRALLGGYSIEPERMGRLRLGEKPHLFTLGYALGFYGVDDEVKVYGDISSDKKPCYNSGGTKKKRICDLVLDDLVYTGRSSKMGLYKLLNFNLGQAASDKFISIRRVEQIWLEMHGNNFPSFPIGYSTGERGSVRMDCALFCITGHQYFGVNGLTKGCAPGRSSYYTIVSPNSLATLAALDIGLRGNLFTRHGFPSSYSLNFHQLRHYTNTVADQSGIPNEVITAWSGRKSREQTNEYIHTSHADRSERVKDVQVLKNDSVYPIRLISRDEINQELNLPASATSTGVCTQNLISNPCHFLNDFISSCFLCPSSCYIAGDEMALEVLDKDLSFQSKRLDAVEKDARLRVSEVIQKWFIAHTENTGILRQLIALVRESPRGAVITFNRKNQHFNLVDVKTKAIECVTYKLPNAKEELRKLLECKGEDDQGQPQSNATLQNLLASYGIGEVD